MPHLRPLARHKALPQKAESLLIKQAQLTLLGQTVEVLGAILALFRPEETAEEE